MMNFIDKITNLTKVMQEMAGGRKRGQIVFWIVFFIGVAISLRYAYDSIEYVFSSLSEMSPLLTIVTFVTSALIGLALILVVAYAIATLFGWSIRTAFATPVSNRIDFILLCLIQILKDANKDEIDKQSIKELLNDVEKMCEYWNSQRITKFIHWLTKHRKANKVKD